MILLKTKSYIKDVKKLAKEDQTFLSVQEIFLQKNIFHTKLHTKKLKGISDLYKVYSFRITIAYRGLFYIKDGQIVLFAVGHRKDIYNML